MTQGVAGDIDGDGDRDAADLSAYVAVLLGTNANPLHGIASDFTGDGSADGVDTQPFVTAFLAP